MLGIDFYRGEDVVAIAKRLLGCELHTNFNGIHTSGIIVETEAYGGIRDKASHSYGGRRTKRTEIMYSEGGVGYVYLCYGIHHLFNVVTNSEGMPDAVLIRAIEPKVGLDIQLERRGLKKLARNVGGGPGLVSRALGLSTEQTGESLISENIWIDLGQELNDDEIIASPRVGVDYAEEHALWPWRFRVKGNGFTSPAK